MDSIALVGEDVRVQWLVRSGDGRAIIDTVTTGEKGEGHRMQGEERSPVLWVLHGASTQAQMESFLQTPNVFK